jgi:hypothetical protein
MTIENKKTTILEIGRCPSIPRGDECGEGVEVPRVQRKECDGYYREAIISFWSVQLSNLCRQLPSTCVCREPVSHETRNVIWELSGGGGGTFLKWVVI